MNIIVTGGGTVAPIDDVRRITNISSGRFSARITEAAVARGARVWHIHALSAQLPFERDAQFSLTASDPAAEIDRLLRLRETWLRARDRLHLVPLRDGTVSDYSRTLRDVLSSSSIDIAFLTMAVSDYEPVPTAGKLDSRPSELTITCRPTPKVIRSVRDWAPDVYLVGFKLLSGAPLPELLATAEAACRTNRADLTVANDWSTIRDRRHTIHLVRPGETTETYSDPGAAERLVERVFSWATSPRAPRTTPTDLSE